MSLLEFTSIKHGFSNIEAQVNKGAIRVNMAEVQRSEDKTEANNYGML